MIESRKAFISGIKGKKLKVNEINFLKKYKPWGVILFSRNIHSLKQTKLLTQSIRNVFKDQNYPILIDEEGGRVSRLHRLIDTSLFSAKYFGDLFCKDIKKFYLYYNVYIKQISYLLHLLGININTVPVLDILRKSSHKIIGDRSYSSNQKIVSKIGDFCIKEFHKNKIGTIIKHIPGHGLAKVDSHIKLPIIHNKYRELLNNDFKVFKNKKSLFSMTSHIIYKKIDKLYSATHSKKIIYLIRKKINYKNLILSDDISMKALKYSISKNTQLAFTAGCNLVMHCNGNMREMIMVAKNSPYIDNFILKKTYQFYNIIR
tara:strand:- start:2633 stop:3583 length:951 start_codon:yes stop_codon:yes gene_type:complete